MHISQVQGVIFDVDETLLDTGGGNHGNTLHEEARYQAMHEAGKRHNLPNLLTLTHEENYAGFIDAPIHSLEGAVWHLLFQKGVVASEALEPANPLLLEIVARKDELYEKLLREKGKPLKGAVAFVEWLASFPSIREHMALATTAIRRDADIFIHDLTTLARFFPHERIVTKEDVTHVKPHPEAFDKAYISLGLPESARPSVLAFEDNPRGIMSAKAAGLYVCAIANVYTKKELAALDVAPDLIADTFAEFRTLLA